MAKIRRLVKHRTVIDRRKGKRISQEPEMKRLKAILSDMTVDEKKRTEYYLSREVAGNGKEGSE